MSALLVVGWVAAAAVFVGSLVAIARALWPARRRMFHMKPSGKVLRSDRT